MAQARTGTSAHIAYIDGLKGLCGIWICLFHYLLAFAAFGYIGWESGIPQAERAGYYFRYFPYSILSNGSFPLYVFFAVIAFLPALRFFQNGKAESVKRQAVIRYFRLMPPVLVCALCAYAVFACGGFFNQDLAAHLDNNWDRAFYTAPLSWTGALANGLFDALWNGNSDYCSVLWCMNVILFGSYFSYGALLFFGSLRRRFWVYAALFLLSFTAPVYTAFLGGLAAADVLAARGGGAQSGRWGGLLALAGLVAGIFPEVLLPSGLTEQTLFGIGAFLLLLGCARSAALQKLLSRSWLVRAGELSFALVLTHFTVLMSFSAWFFLAVQGQGLSYVPALTLTLATAVPVNYAFTLLFKLFAEGPAERFAHWIYRCVA